MRQSVVGESTGTTERGGRKKRKSRHPAEEPPSYKSLNCEPNGESPSAAAFAAFPLRLLPTGASFYFKTQRSGARGACEEKGFFKKSGSKRHNTFDCMPSKFFLRGGGDFHCKCLKNKCCTFQKKDFWQKTNKLLFVYWLACWEIPQTCPTKNFLLAAGDSAHVVPKKGRAERRRQ